MKKELMPPPRGMIGPRSLWLCKELRAAFNEICASHGLFSGQQDVLFQLVDNEGLTVGDLANNLRISKATASVSIKRMEKSGFVKKAPDETDGRIVRLYPTEKAKALPEIIKEKMDALEAIMSSGMTEEELGKLSDLLDLAIKNIKNRGETDA